MPTKSVRVEPSAPPRLPHFSLATLNGDARAWRASLRPARLAVGFTLG
ncbi:MAG: hypothetical protein JSV86_01720 [Gemmatimonadota bacterium]|nr:MAG: hypothetical protein JSV86_01720 [Gemmatimonadota bacterium]